MTSTAAPQPMTRRAWCALVAALAMLATLLTQSGALGSPPDRGMPSAGQSWTRVIVRSDRGVESAADAVRRNGGTVRKPLPIIDGVAADVPASRVGLLRRDRAVAAVTSNDRVTFDAFSYGDEVTDSAFVGSSGAGAAWNAGSKGEGVGVAIIDTGTSPMPDLKGRVVYGPDLSGEGRIIDSYGHGTVMAGLVAGNGNDSRSPRYTGVAPNAHVVSVKVAGRNGVTDVSTVLEAMHWVSAYKDQFQIRVLNLSWGTGSTQSHTLDPLNFAVQRLWKQGIVVVVAAGNSGPDAGTIRKPADDPMVITVGAYDDRGNTNPSDDQLPKWSSRGPTANLVPKPDFVAPGRTVIATRSHGSTVEQENPKALVAPSYIKGSGSSQAAAITSGLAALLLAKRPTLTPDQVKALLTKSGSPMALETPSSQGTGRVNLASALTADPGPAQWQTSTATGLGSLDLSRGGRSIQTDCNGDGLPEIITGEITYRCQQWNGGTWTGGTWTGGTWTGGTWTGGTWTGGTWTGGTWTGGTWTGGTWTDAVWSGGTWTGGTWTGGTWTNSDWTGGTWTGGTWTGGTWTGGTWTGGTWTGGTWTSSGYESGDDEFLTAFWGPRPPYWVTLPGEQSERVPANNPVNRK